MLTKSTLLTYAFCLIMSTGRKNFTNINRENKINNKKTLQPADRIFTTLQELCQTLFKDAKKLILVVDETLIKKIYSQWMQGSGKFYDTKTGRSITSFNLLVGAISDGKKAIPISASYIFANRLIYSLIHGWVFLDLKMDKTDSTDFDLRAIFVCSRSMKAIITAKI